MDQLHVIRPQVLVEKRSRRQVARELGISRLTVRKYLAQSAPERRDAEPRARPVWTKVEALVAAVLSASAQWTGGKQQLTATRVHQLLVGEGHRVDVTLVKEAVAEWKRQRREVFIPLTYRPGELAEVDFFEVLVDVAGVRQKAWLFLLRLMYSGRDFGWIYERQDQISFLDCRSSKEGGVNPAESMRLCQRDRGPKRSRNRKRRSSPVVHWTRAATGGVCRDDARQANEVPSGSTKGKRTSIGSCCAVHAAVGCAVTFTWTMRRRS
jgi:hypothetical protein